VLRLRSSSDGAGESILDELKEINLSLVEDEIVVERVTVVKFGMDYGSSDDGGCFEVDERVDAA
jgi:hypothetical protein